MKLAAQDALCAGCKLCQVACSLSQFKERDPGKTAIKVWSEHVRTGSYHVTTCAQCGTCAATCPVGAITMVGRAYRINPELCTQCLLCVEACPRHAMFTHPEVATPIKCILCKECVSTCPTNALSIVD